MPRVLTIMLIMTASTANAHPGHWADLAGHDHWVAGAAIGLAGIAAVWGALKGKQKDAQTEAENEPEKENA